MAKVRKSRKNPFSPLQILESHSVKQPDGCWLWAGYTNKKGYARLYYEGKNYIAHRFAFIELVGDPGDLQIMHTCNNASCVNPDHLHAGTNQDNVDYREAFRRGAFQKAHLPRNSKLTNEQANAIKTHIRHYTGMQTIAEMAAIFSVKVSAIKDIKNGRSYVNSHKAPSEKLTIS